MNIEPIAGFHEPVSSLTHLGGALVAAIVALPLLRLARGDRTHIATVFIYIASVIVLLSISGVYHLLDPAGAGRQVMVRLDYAAIWLLIAGTFTGVHGVLFRGPWRWGFLLVVWGAATVGIVLKTVYFQEVPQWAIVVFYLAFGWLGALTGARVMRLGRRSELRWLIAGGAFYSAGAVLDLARVGSVIPGVVGHHEIFHVCVLIGVACHWKLITMALGPKQLVMPIVPKLAPAAPKPARDPAVAIKSYPPSPAVS